MEASAWTYTNHARLVWQQDILPLYWLSHFSGALREWNKEYSSIIEWVELSKRHKWPDSYATTQISDKLP